MKGKKIMIEQRTEPTESRVNPIYICDICGEPIMPGDKYYCFPDSNICLECIDDYIGEFRSTASETEVKPTGKPINIFGFIKKRGVSSAGKSPGWGQ